MFRDRYDRAFVAMLIAAAAVRVNNVWRFPSLRAFDGYGHFTYIWFMADQWRVPLATSGWSFFHPPLYYAFMASFWKLLAPMDAVARLNVGTTIIALLGLLHGLLVYRLARRYLPDTPTAALLAAGLMFFLPVHLYSAAFLGNENLNAVFCSLALVAVLWVLHRPSARRGAVLGLCLGAAMLTKFTSLAIVLGALGTIALRTLVLRSWRTGATVIMGTVVVMTIVCGWFYARNVMIYGTPFVVSRDEFMVRHVENYQSQGRRNFWEYVLFDPLILRRPQWPRGIPLNGEFGPEFPHDALRESVPTGLYANAWFDGGPGNVLPSIAVSETSRRSGQLLLTLGLVPSVLVLVGIAVGIRRLWRSGWDDTLALMVVTFMTMLTLFVKAMNTVPMHAAVKATYLFPVTMVFAFWLAVGADALGRASERWLKRAAIVCAAVAAVSIVVFSTGVFINRDWLKEVSEKSAPWQNLYGVVYWAAGDQDHARQLFEASAKSDWHLGNENLGFLAYRDHRLLEALYRVRLAALQEPKQSFGTRVDRAQFDRSAQADYQNEMAVIYYELNRLDLAVAAATKAYKLDRTIPEVRYDLAVLTLVRALAAEPREPDQLRRALTESRALLAPVVAADPAFFEPAMLAGLVDVMAGECDRGTAAMRAAHDRRDHGHRIYPVTTGTGNMHAAGLARRMHIQSLPDVLQPERQAGKCTAAVAAG